MWNYGINTVARGRNLQEKKSRAGSLENKKNFMECMQQNMGDLLEYI